MNRCMQTAANYYTLFFDPPVAVQPHEYHTLQVRVDRPGLVARTNTGYYNEPFYSDQPNPAVRRVTVEQLEQLLSEAHGRENDKLAEELSKLELTERLSFAQLSSWTAKLRNRNVRNALIAVADASAFLEPPPDEILNQAVAGEAAQQHMLVGTKDYLQKSIPKLPDFYARRGRRFAMMTPRNSVRTRSVLVSNPCTLQSFPRREFSIATETKLCNRRARSSSI